MKYIIIPLLIVFLCSEVIAQERATRSRRGGASASSDGVESPFHNGSSFESIPDCIDSGCPCCLFQGHVTVNRIEIDRTVCRTENTNMDDVASQWGPSEVIYLHGFIFTLYNVSASQSRKIQEILSVLPDFYLQALPHSIRIGNPSTGGIRVSSGTTIGGGSRRCWEKNEDFEYIIIHPLVFTTQGENPRRTLLHEAGHFIDREYQIAKSLMATHGDQFESYLATYSGDSKGEDEVIAQGVMYYFQKKYWDVNGHRIEDGEITPTDRMPQWLIDIIQADIDSRS